MDKETRTAINNAACHVCDILNTSLSTILDKPLTPEKLVYILMMSEEEAPSGQQDETLGTVRGLMQRIYHLKNAVQGHPGTTWKRYWAKNGLHVVKETTEQEQLAI